RVCQFDLCDDGSATAAFHVVDTIKPSLAVSHATDGANGFNKTSPVSVSISASDGGSGLAGTPTCTDNGGALTVTGSSSPYAASVAGDGTHAISCSVADNAANSTVASDTVKIDTVAPTVAITSGLSGFAAGQQLS